MKIYCYQIPDMKEAKRIDSPSAYLLFARRGAKRIYNFVVMFMAMHYCANFVIAVRVQSTFTEHWELRNLY